MNTEESKINEQKEINELKNEQKEIKINFETNDLKDALNKINNSIKHLNDVVENVEVDNSINMNNSKINPELVDAKNKKLTDYELCKRVLYNIDNDLKNNKTIKIQPDFIQFMRDFVSHVDAGGSAVEFKNNNVYKMFDLQKINI